MLSACPPTATTSGVRVSCRPRRMPVVASMTSSGVTPRKAIRRYVSPARPPPARRHRRTSGPVVATPTRVMTTPTADGEPDPVDALGEGRPPVAGAQQAGDTGRWSRTRGRRTGRPASGARGGDAETGQGCGAEVADDRRVGEQEQRLRDEREERRERPAARISRSSAGRGGGPRRGGLGVRTPADPGHRPSDCLCTSGGNRAARIGRSADCRLAARRIPDGEWMNDRSTEDISGAHLWDDVSAGQRPDRGRPGRVLHSGSPGRCTARPAGRPRVRRSFPQAGSQPVDNCPRPRGPRAPGTSTVQSWPLHRLSVEAGSVSVAPPTVTPVASVPDPEAA